jgi:hypothetical protein
MYNSPVNNEQHIQVQFSAHKKTIVTEQSQSKLAAHISLDYFLFIHSLNELAAMINPNLSLLSLLRSASNTLAHSDSSKIGSWYHT